MNGLGAARIPVTAHVSGMMNLAAGPLTMLWIDTETTGLSMHDHLLEITVIGTDDDLNELASFSTVIRPTQLTWELIDAQPVVKDMHTVNGLLDELANARDAPTVRMVEDRIISMITRYADPDGGKVQIAGGGVSHFDQPYLRALMPQLSSMLHYRPMDITQAAQAYTKATGASQFGEKPSKAHRSEIDIREDLERARLFWAMCRAIHEGAVTPVRATGRIATDGFDALLAGTQVVRAFMAAEDSDDDHRLRQLIGTDRDADALAGVTAIAAKLARAFATQAGIETGEALTWAMKELA